MRGPEMLKEGGDIRTAKRIWSKDRKRHGKESGKCKGG